MVSKPVMSPVQRAVKRRTTTSRHTLTSSLAWAAHILLGNRDREEQHPGVTRRGMMEERVAGQIDSAG
jgi:hypothetical protein